MRKRVVFINLIVLFIMFLGACEENKLGREEAEKILKESIEKSRWRTVFFYVGPSTDEKYLPAYRKVAEESEYLDIKDNVYVKRAGRKMTVFSITEKGKENLQCEKNRCEVKICEYRMGKINTIKGIPQSTTVEFTRRLDCDNSNYKAFLPLAEMQHVAPGIISGKAYFQQKEGKWELYEIN
ncbi:MAG: hypothetical protein R6W70_00155 [bacterium]